MHAGCGCGSNTYSFLDTGVPYDVTRPRPMIDVSTDNYLLINGQKSLIQVHLLVVDKLQRMISFNWVNVL